MKNIITLLLICFSLGAFSQGGEMKLVPQKNSDNYKVYFQADIKSNVEVIVKNEKEKVVHSLKFKDKDGFILPIDFSKFESGNYTVELHSPFYTLTENVTFFSQIDQLREKIEAEVLQEKRRVLITLLEPVDGDLNLSISDAEGNVVRQESINGKEFGMRAFDFSDTQDNVSITVYYEGQHLDTWQMGD
jgi:hypothetical protein